MNELNYRVLVWLSYRLAAVFAIGLPLVLALWAAIRQESSILRLLTIYWKTASLLFITALLLTDQRSIGYLSLFVSPFLLVTSVWFWVDLNEELNELPTWKPLILTVKVWRIILTLIGVLTAYLSSFSLSCIQSSKASTCIAWLDAPKGVHEISEKVFSFLFGANWTPPLAAFIGYLTLLGYTVGLLQLILIRIPKNGRIAGDF